MMDREWGAILARHGQVVTVYPTAQAPGQSVRAFLQPVLEKGAQQRLPTPLGFEREDRFLYLGPVDTPLAAGESLVEWAGGRYQVQCAHQVGANHHWAVLRPMGKEEEL